MCVSTWRLHATCSPFLKVFKVVLALQFAAHSQRSKVKAVSLAPHPFVPILSCADTPLVFLRISSLSPVERGRAKQGHHSTIVPLSRT